MPIIFDEITAEVAPPAPAAPPREQAEAPQPMQQPDLMQQLRRIERRAERIQAD